MRADQCGKGLLAVAALFAGAPAFAQSAAIASNPATLNQGNLRGAIVSVTLAGTTYSASSTVSHFTLVTAVPGLSVHSGSLNSGRTVANLRLHYDGSDFDAAATIAVTVAAAGTGHNAALTTGTQAIAPARWVNVSTKTIALAEGGSAGSYTVALESPPSGDVAVAVASDNAAVTVGGAASITLTFTTQNWNTAQTVTVAPVDDDADTHDELALVTNVATGGGYVSNAVANRTVRIAVADDEQTGTDYDTDDDQLIEIDSLAQLNAVRHDLDGNGAPLASAAFSYAAAFPGAAAGMGCPDSGDSNQTPDGCKGYELTADLDFDTDGDGDVDANDPGSYPDWLPIGVDSADNVAMPGYTATFRGNGYVIDQLSISERAANGLFARPSGGLFARVDPGGRIESLGLTNVDVGVFAAGGAITGNLAGHLVASYAAGRVTVSATSCGGLAGRTHANARDDAAIIASYSAVAVTCQGLHGGVIRGVAGGMVGYHANGPISASYAIGSVTGESAPDVVAGGLSGHAGAVSTLWVGTLFDSYWDKDATGRSISSTSRQAGVTTGNVGTAIGTTRGAVTAADMQSPTDYTGIYAFWDDLDLDGDGRVDADDDAWNFGTSSQYPVLKWGGFDPSAQFALQPSDEADSAEPANRAPEPASALSNALLAVGEELRVDLAAAFRDADGDALSYSAVSSAPAVVLASVAGDTLVLSGVSAGMATVTISAADPHGLSVEQTLAVTVGTLLSLEGDGEAVEGGTVRLSVRLNTVRDVPTAFSWKVLEDEDPATADADAGEHGDASGSGSIAAGETTATIEIDIADDADVEPPREWFLVELLADADDPVTLGRARASVAVLEGVCDRTSVVATALVEDGGCETATDAGLAALRTLSLPDAGIAALGADDLAGLHGLRVLGLGGNALTELPEGLLSNAPALRFLLLGGNRLSALRGDAFAGLSQLLELDLSNNALAELPSGMLSGLTELRHLRLDGNALEALPEGLFSGVSSLRSVRLDGNPGAPFALRAELRRNDAPASAKGPATIQTTLASAAPFDVELSLAATGGGFRAADGSVSEQVRAPVAAGETASAELVVVASDAPAVRVSLSVGPLPETVCNGRPCWRGLTLQASDPLVLFATPPTAADMAPKPEPLFGEDLRLPLASLVTAGGLPVERWQASSSNPSVATASVKGDELVVAAEPGVEDVAEIELLATDAMGQSVTVRFEVQVAFYWPSPRRWRLVLPVAE